MSLPTLLLPVKSTARGKSRLSLPADVRQSVALAMALDTATAAAEVLPVIVLVETVTDAAALSAVPGVTTHLSAVTGLNEAIVDGLGLLDGGEVAVLPADLPGLLAGDLRRALDMGQRHGFAVVADREGVGTTLLMAASTAELRPRYGPDSFRLHVEAGAVALSLPPTSTVRRDIDETGDFAGSLGPRTRAVLQSSGLFADLTGAAG